MTTSFQLQANESVEAGIKRITCEQLQSAINQLQGKTDKDPEEIIHDTRKRLKKVRAILRLVRDEIGESRYQKENTCFRNAARHLSGVRDAQVLIDTLDHLVKHFSDLLAQEAFSGIREILNAHYTSVQQEVVQDTQAIPLVADILTEAQSRVADWSIKHNDWSALEKGLKQVYKRGYNALPTAYKDPTPENFHEWRKQAKYLWYHLGIIQPIWSDMMDELDEQLHDLSDYLGDEHDLAVLQEFLLEHCQTPENQTDVEVLLPLINHRRLELQKSAHSLGKRIYAEKPKRFVQRLGIYWQIWREEYGL